MITREELLQKHRLKIIASIISVVLWIYVLASEPIEAEKEFKINLIPPTGYAVSNITPHAVSLKFKGPRAIIRQLSGSNRTLDLPLEDYPYKKNKSFSVRVDLAKLEIPFGVNVIAVAPKAFNVTLGKRIMKKVPIKASLVGDLPKDQNLVKTALSPQNIMIAGAIEVMRTVPNVSTLPIDQSNFSGQGKISNVGVTVDPRVEIVDDAAVNFSYETKPKMANMVLSNVKIRFLSSTRRFSPSKRYVNLSVLMGDDEKNKLSSLEFYVLADIPEGAKGTVTVPLKAVLPEGVHLLEIHPSHIGVRVR